MMKLYYFPVSNTARPVRLMIAEYKLPVEDASVDAVVGTLVKKVDVVAIKEAINASGERGIRSFDVALHNMYKQNRIELEEALTNADSRSNLEAKINFG